MNSIYKKRFKIVVCIMAIGSVCVNYGVSRDIFGAHKDVISVNDVVAMSETISQGVGKGIAKGFSDAINRDAATQVAQDVGFGISKGLIDGVGTTLHENVKEGGGFHKGALESASLFGKTLDKFGDEVHKQSRSGGGLHRGFQSMNTMGLEAAYQWQGLFLDSVRVVALTALGVSLAYFVFKYGIKTCIEHIDRKLRKPALLKQLSKGGSLRKKRLKMKRYKAERSKMIFAQKQEEQLTAIANAVVMIKKRIKAGFKNVTFRNLLLSGPPGTGKTMFAEQLAKETGMAFAILSGSSLSQFRNGKAITEIDHLFAWAEKNKNGTIIFIDEVDALFPDRGSMPNKDSEAYKNMCHIFSLTGSRSAKIMLIMTTNKSDSLDEAIESRVDDEVIMGLPDTALRERLLRHYINTIFYNIKENSALFIDAAKAVFTDDIIKDMAKKTEGYEHRRIHSLVNILFSDTLSTKDMCITPTLINNALEQVHERRMRKEKRQ